MPLDRRQRIEVAHVKTTSSPSIRLGAAPRAGRPGPGPGLRIAVAAGAGSVTP
jgi:hypothetical protein